MNVATVSPTSIRCHRRAIRCIQRRSYTRTHTHARARVNLSANVSSPTIAALSATVVQLLHLKPPSSYSDFSPVNKIFTCSSGVVTSHHSQNMNSAMIASRRAAVTALRSAPAASATASASARGGVISAGTGVRSMATHNNPVFKAAYDNVWKVNVRGLR